MVGCVDNQGKHSGDGVVLETIKKKRPQLKTTLSYLIIFLILGPDIAFLYPNFTTALLGEFNEGILVKAKEARLSNIGIMTINMKLQLRK